MLCPASYVKRFAMCTMDRVLERLERPPLGAVAPTDSEAKALVSTSPTTGIPSMESWPEMGSATAHPTGATLALGDPSVSLNAMGGGGGL